MAGAICKLCKSPIRGLSDAVMQYIESFLPVDDLDRFLRVSHWFQTLVLLPYPVIASRADLYETCNEIHRNSATGVIHYRAMDRATRQWRVLKVIPKSSIYTRRRWQEFQQLLNMMFGIHHPNFVDVFAVHQTGTEVLIAFEFLDIVPLQDITRQLTEKDIVHIGWQILRAVKHLHHDLKVVHRNFARAIMIEENTLQIKVLMKCGFFNFGMTVFPEAGDAMESLIANTAPASTSRVFCHRYTQIHRPPPVIIPGGRDESLFRKCEKFRKAAIQRHQNVSNMEGRRREFSGCDEMGSGSFSNRGSSASIFASFRGEERMTFRVLPRGMKMGYVAPELAELCALRTSNIMTAASLMACDMYTVGILLYRCFTGCVPYKASNWNVMAHVMCNRKIPPIPDWNSNVTSEAVDLVMSLIRREPAKRQTVKSALCSEWFKNGQSDGLLLAPSSPPNAPRGPRPGT
jgi:serine/threonine protein kinase